MPIRRLNRIVALIDRSTGRACSIVFNDGFNANNVASFLYTRVDRESRLLTDEAGIYKPAGLNFASHGSVDHFQDEYVASKTRPSTRRRLKASSRPSSAGCAASISTAGSSTCSAI